MFWNAKTSPRKFHLIPLMVLFGVIFLAHTVIFFWHQYLIYRYETLYTKMTNDSMLVVSSVEFRSFLDHARTRPFLTRTDKLITEAKLLEDNVTSLIFQYSNDLFHKYDAVLMNIQLLHTIIQIGHEIALPEISLIEKRTLYLESQITSDANRYLAGLDNLLLLSESYVGEAREHLEKAQKTIVLSDIEDLKHEIVFLDSLYRVTPDAFLVFDKGVFDDVYAYLFSNETIQARNSLQLRSSWQYLSDLLEPYRIESKFLRAIAAEKRKSLVDTEEALWNGKEIPVAPVTDVFQQIYVNLKEQKMYVFEDGELIKSTSITSGRQNFETIRGTFRIYSKDRNKIIKSPFPGEDYELWVDYWLGFHGYYGIHDACNKNNCWRRQFGGASYVYNGSHGCINTPYDVVQMLYNWSSIGTTVHIQ